MKNLQEIVELLSRSGYAKIAGRNNFEFLPLGSLLMQNIQNEWFKNKNDLNIHSVNNEQNQNYNNHLDYLKTQQFKNNFLHVKNNFQKDFPLIMKTSLASAKSQALGFDLQINKNRLLICDYFFNEIQAYDKYSKIQRERKIWWMKLSVDPGRFYFSDLKTEFVKKRKLQSIKLKAKFNFGDIDLENIYVIPLKTLELNDSKDFLLNDRKFNRKILPVIVHTEICSEIATTAVLFDALENSKNSNICLQRNIAPYQCSIYCINENQGESELEKLAKHINFVLQKLSIRSLYSNKFFFTDRKALERQLHQSDQIGVPYSIILDVSSLLNGILKLRNRDTTLSEEIHIANVPDYLPKIFSCF